MTQVGELYELWLSQNVSPQAQALMPNTYDACRLPSLYALAALEHIQGDVTPQDFLLVVAQMLVEAQDYKVRARDLLIELLRKQEDLRADVEILLPDVILQRHYALFGCGACPRWTRMPYTAIHAHWRTAHPTKSWFADRERGRNVVDYFGTHDVGAKILDYAGIPRDTPLGTLNMLIREGRLYCACGDPSLLEPAFLTWEDLLYHVVINRAAYKFRQDVLRYVHS